MHAQRTGSDGTSVLFVCLGNICRSPLAEGVFRHLVTLRGLEARFHIDSAGTGAWHVGEPPDTRSVAVAADHGIDLAGTARQVTAEDLTRFDFIVAMDRDNLDALIELAEDVDGTGRIELMRAFDPEPTGEDVPDPYYGGPGGFERVYQMIRRACEGLLDELNPR